MSQASQDRWEQVDPVAKKVISHLSIRNRELKYEIISKEYAIKTALSMLSKCGGDVFGYAKEVRLWRWGWVLSTVGPYVSKKTGKVTSYAHYNRNGKYIQRCKEGDDPIPVSTGMVVTERYFRWSEEEEDFVPIPYEELVKKKLKFKVNKP
jgi:hypothetical protein